MDASSRNDEWDSHSLEHWVRHGSGPSSRPIAVSHSGIYHTAASNASDAFWHAGSSRSGCDWPWRWHGCTIRLFDKAFHDNVDTDLHNLRTRWNCTHGAIHNGLQPVCGKWSLRQSSDTYGLFIHSARSDIQRRQRVHSTGDCTHDAICTHYNHDAVRTVDGRRLHQYGSLRVSVYNLCTSALPRGASHAHAGRVDGASRDDEPQHNRRARADVESPQGGEEGVLRGGVREWPYDNSHPSNVVVKRLAENEILEPVLEVYKTDYFPGVPTLAVVSNRRLLLITEDRRGGVYWPLKTTQMTRCEEGGLMRNGKFFFKSMVADSKEHVLEFKDRKSASLLATLFEANRAYGEYSFVAIKNRSNVVAVFSEECDRVTRFSHALSACSSNPEAMFAFLLSMDSVLPLVKRQLRAAANEWAKSNMGTTSVEDFEVLDVIQQDSDEAAYYGQLASQIASFLAKGSYMKKYSGAIPLLDAYYFYGKATASDLKSPGGGERRA